MEKQVLIKCIKTDKMTGIKKGQNYPLIDAEYNKWNVKVKVNKKDIWFRGYYFEDIK